MADTLHLRILTPEREVFDAEVQSMTAEGALGQFGVLPRHITFLTALEPGPLTYTERPGASRTIAVKGGYAEVRDDVVTVLADDAVRPSDVNPAAARVALEDARRALEERPFGHPEHEEARREVRWAEVLSELTNKGGTDLKSVPSL